MVDMVWESVVFGDSTISKEFAWYPAGSNYVIARQHLAKNFGLTYSWSDVGPTDYYLTGCIIDGVQYGTLVGVKDAAGIPSTFTLHQNYPNPFNPSTTIDYALPRSAYVKLEVFNTLGERVSVLSNGLQDAGYHSAVFNAEGLPSGIYFYRLQARQTTGGQAGDFVETKKLILLK